LKILYLVSTLVNCGPTNQLYNIIKNLDRNLFEPIIVTLSDEKQKSQIDKFQDLNIEVKSLELDRNEGLFFINNKIIKFFDEINPDLIHSSGLRADKVAQSYTKNLKVPHIMTLRNYPYYDYPSKYGNFLGYLYSILHVGIIKKAKNAVACSKSISKIFKENLNIDIDFVQNGVDTDKYYKADKEQKINLRANIGLSKDAIIFVTTGDLISRKNNKTVVSAFNIIADKFSNLDLRLCFVGDGYEKNMLEKLTVTNNKILFLGKKPNVTEYLQSSDFFISASIAEGLPNSVIEALACGLPCILSDIEPHKEILSLNSNAGALFQVENVLDLVKQIELILQNNIKDKSAAAIEIINSYLSAISMSNKYQQLYKKFK